MKANCKRSLPRCSIVCPVWRALAPACPVRAAAGAAAQAPAAARAKASWNTTAAMCAAASTRCANAWKSWSAAVPKRARAAKTSGVPVVALVGYTNVGKSSLLNRLCGAQVLEADMLFATLDPTARRLSLPSGLACVAVDTVAL